MTGTASTADTCHFQNAFDPANTRRDVYADRGYPSKAREAWLKREGYRSQISSEGPKEQAPVRVPTPSEPQDIEVACSSRARVCRDRADERQDGPHHRPGQGQFRDDDDGGLLQHEAARLLPENGYCGLLTPEFRPDDRMDRSSGRNSGYNRLEMPRIWLANRQHMGPDLAV